MESPRLPLELIRRICEELLANDQKGSLAAFLPCSRDLYDLVAPLLYRSVTLTRANASLIFNGLATPPERLRKRSRKLRSAPGDISWGRFKSRDFYLEWASIYESAPDESLRSRREYLIWPVVDADSGDEDEDEDGGDGDLRAAATNQVLPTSGPSASGRPRPRTQLAWPHPTRISHQRKDALLKHVKRLHLAELPAMDLSQTLHDLSIAGRFRIGAMRVQLSVGPKAFWQLADWLDRHRGQEHPFLHVIYEMDISNLCVQYPVIDQALEISYMTSRIVTNEEHLSRASAVDQYTYLRFSMPHLLRHGFYDLTRRLCSQGSLGPVRIGTITVHNVAGNAQSIDVQDMKITMWFRPCSCQDIYLSNQVLDTACYNHYTPEIRLQDAMEAHGAAFADNTTSKRISHWDLIDFDWETGRNQPMSHSARWPGLRDEFWRDLQTADLNLGRDGRADWSDRVRFLNSVDAENCICCGKGQLSYEEVP